MIKTVKYSLVALAAAALASVASAQITPRPLTWSSAGVDGLNSFTNYLTPAQQADFAAAGLNIASNGNVALPSGFTLGTPSIALNPLGGSVKVFFIGESAGWLNDLGYVVNPQSATLTSPSVYNPLVVNIQGNPLPPASPLGDGNLQDNTFATVSYGAGDKLDFFLNGVGGGGIDGGTWFVFGTPNQFAGGDNSIHTKYEYLTIAGVSTLVIALEDSRRSAADGDFSDVLIAFQGTGTPVPEPSTYGLIGAAALLGLVGLRRFKRKA